MGVFLVEGARREGYDPLREPVSALALGERGWVQRANFVGTGLLMLACSRGLASLPPDHPASSRWGARLVALYAIGLVGAGVFVTDPVGYGAPDPALSSTPTRDGVLHGLFSMDVFAALAAASLVYARRLGTHDEPGPAVASTVTGVLVPVGIVSFGQALARTEDLGRVAGLIQRLTIGLGWSWLTGLALFARRSDGRPRHLASEDP